MRFTWQGSVVTATVCTVILACRQSDAGRPPIAAGPFAGMAYVPLANGMNWVDLDGDGRDDVVFVAWRENYNAHGYTAATFYWRKDSDSLPGPTWQVMPFTDSRGLEIRDALYTSQGADCILSDFRMVRVLRPGHGAAVVVVGTREMGESYVDSQTVPFTAYEVARNTEGLAGEPTVYFRESGATASRGKYCDVGEAFVTELSIPQDTAVQ